MVFRLLLALCGATTVAHAQVAVVVHSETGRTARAGKEMATMLRARVSATSEALPAGTRVLYLGFPIFDEAPAPAARAFVDAADLHGVVVVPFYTHLHYADPAKLAELSARIVARGGVARAPLAMLVPLSFSDFQIACLARRTLLAHREAWPWPVEPAPVVRCAGGWCRVPAGHVWLGDTSEDCVNETPIAVEVGGFSIAEREVSAAEYARCKTCGAIGNEMARALDKDTGWAVAGPSLRDARAYCASIGARLPHEAEWIRAGRGDGVSPYPWGARFDPHEPPRGNFGEANGLPHYSVAGPDWPRDGHTGLAPSCAFPSGKSPFGLCDLAGNLAEWVDEGFLKGGSWLDGEPTALRLGSRATVPGGIGFYLSGLRCAR
jgi:formylglycine-generating enzyme required for sulfatase activity